MKLKPLVKKFAYHSAKELEETEGWKLPYYDEVKDLQEVPYLVFWLADQSNDEFDAETHGYIYENGEKYLCNKSFQFNIAVLVEEDTDDNTWRSKTNYSICTDWHMR